MRRLTMSRLIRIYTVCTCMVWSAGMKGLNSFHWYQNFTEERANLSAFRTFVRFVLVWVCRFPLPFGVWEGLRFVIVALPGLFSYFFFQSRFKCCENTIFLHRSAGIDSLFAKKKKMTQSCLRMFQFSICYVTIGLSWCQCVCVCWGFTAQ